MKNMKYKLFVIIAVLALAVFFIFVYCSNESEHETINEDAVTLEDVYEPYLLQSGFLTRTPRGRCVTRKAYEHLGLSFQKSEQLEF